MHEEISQGWIEYQKINKIVNNVLESPVLCRIFFLILDGVNSNKEISKAYADTKNIAAKIPNPKVIAIHLKRLREVNLIIRTQKVGVIQKYAPNWNGLLNILKYHEFRNKGNFGISYFYNRKVRNNGKRWIIQETYKEKAIPIIDNHMINELIVPFFKRRKEGLKLTQYADVEDERWLIKEIHPKNFDTINFGLKDVLLEFDRGFGLLSEYNQEEIVALSNNDKLKKTFIGLLINHFQHERDVELDSFIERPEAIVVNLFHNLINKFKSEDDKNQ